MFGSPERSDNEASHRLGIGQRLDALCELVEMDRRLAAGIDTDDSLFDAHLARYVDLVMTSEEDWVDGALLAGH